MVHFQLKTNSFTRVLLNIASAHGFADLFLKPRWKLLVYCFCLIPVPGKVTTALFFSLSSVHFSDDMGLPISLAAHFMSILIASKKKFHNHAFAVAVAYTALVHTPLFYLNLLQNAEYASLASAVLGTCFFMFTDILFDEHTFTLSRRRQAVASCHIIARF
jgi:hypothetical protein